MHQVQRPNVAEVHEVLNRWGGIVVHFSGIPRGVSSRFEGQFPDDLRNIVDGNADGGISCSTVRPGDIFEGHPRQNSWGCVGVIVRSRNPWSLVGVDALDCGSSLLPGSNDRDCAHIDLDLSIEEVIRSLEGRWEQKCNEWVMRDFDVLGLLVQHPMTVVEYGRVATQEELLYAAGGKPIYSLSNVDLREVTPAFALGRQVPISELYPV